VIEVVEREDGVAFRTKGDANEDPDAQLVTPDQVVGEVPTIGGYLFVIPYIGYVVQFMQTTTGFVALFVVPIALLIVSEIWNVVAASRRTEPTPSDTDDDAAADESSASTASDEVAGATSADGDSATETEADGLTFSALELQLGLAVLTAFLAYSLWVVYAAFEIFEAGVIWASGVAAAVAVAFLLFLGLYLSGRRGGDDPDRNEAVTAADGGESRASDSEREPTGEADPEEAGKFDWPSEAESGADAAGSVAGGEADE
jgi:signal peptidase